MKYKLKQDKRQPMGVVCVYENGKQIRAMTIPKYLELDWT
jgi:hypothetical protein